MSAGARPRVGVRDLGAEALAGVTQRPLRSVLTGAGAAIGVCAVVTVLGLTATATAQVNERFDLLRAREITVTAADGSDPASRATGQAADAAAGSEVAVALPADATAHVAAIPGVTAAGLVGGVDLGTAATVTSLPLRTRGVATDDADVRTATAGTWAVLHPHLAAGRLFDAGHERRSDRVAVLGTGAASRLGISRLDAQPAVFLDGVAFTVIGIVDQTRREPDLLRSVIVPASTARAVWSDPSSAASHDSGDGASDGATLLVETELGAATTVAARIPWVIDPAHPDRTRVDAPPDPKALGASVGHDLDVLSLGLAAVSVLLGALGISNTMLVTVMERIHEIGLRRALGASGWHIGSQFLVESAILGGAGGLVGSSLGVAVVVGAAVVRDWSPVLAPGVVLLAPLLGLVAGLVAGVFPALRAARVQPADALRR